MQFDLGSGSTAHVNYTGTASLSLGSDQRIKLKVEHEHSDGTVSVTSGHRIAEIVLGAAGIVLAIVGGLGGAFGRTAASAVTSATEGTLGAAEAGEEGAMQVEQITVTACRGLASGTPAEVSQIAARAFAIAKVAGVGVFLSGVGASVPAIIEAIADGAENELPKIVALTDAAVGMVVVWPQSLGGFTVSTAALNGCLQFGLTGSPSRVSRTEEN